ncbi:hypothetical protein H4219_005648 [Mycoemilia scoparia]|uniref:NADH dehydrogenase [ubiquinone] 1 alpha subcomplex subunit 13 n=1 Tax=Mycoemilia scoparia TaxID=417184 RepID=A0A9W7ZM40_9FUNG|nr:hypothetical protein H4219_005648 [Mycoemilia scoparia]
MASRAVQDHGVSGAYPRIQYERRLPKKGPSGIVFLGAIAGVMGYGWYKVYQGIMERKELDREKMWSRIHLVPVLQAESDRDEHRRNKAAEAREREIMKGVEGWEVGKNVYNSNKYMGVTIANIPKSQQPSNN